MAVRNGQIDVVFRYDDPCARTSFDFEDRLLDLFAAHDASITFGVVPLICSEGYEERPGGAYLPLPTHRAVRWRDAVDEGILEVALHGLHHQSWDPPKKTEFAGRPVASQYAAIERGKTYLEGEIGRTVSTFIPPWNSYDLHTVEALDSLGFCCLSASIPCPAVATKLCYLPCSCTLERTGALVAAAERVEVAAVIVVNIHEYQFAGEGGSATGMPFDEFRHLLGELSARPRVRIRTLAAVAGESGELYNEGALKSWQRWREIGTHIPSGLGLAQVLLPAGSPYMRKQARVTTDLAGGLLRQRLG
jgi:peptidoglycan/xylan/chitin deacetylase (PgdA/CDA1 family)